MKDFIQFVIYSVVSFAGIMLLIKMSQSDIVSPNVLVLTSISLVVILPVIIAVRVAKKERANKQLP